MPLLHGRVRGCEKRNGRSRPCGRTPLGVLHVQLEPPNRAHRIAAEFRRLLLKAKIPSESASDAPGGSVTRGTERGIRMETTKSTMEGLARQLSVTAGRPVVDKTGLSGFYAFTLDWFPANRIPAPDLDAPSMFAALQEQLGLRLESSKGPMEKLIVDHAEKPSEN